MPAITTTEIDNAVETWVAESRYTLQERPGVIWKNLQTENLPMHKGSTVTIPKYTQVTTQAITQGVDLTDAQTITDTGSPITPARFGAKVILTDDLLDTVRDDFFKVAGRILGESFDRQREQTLADDLDNFSLALGTAGTAMNLGHVMASHHSIKYNAPADGTAGRGGEPARDPVHGFFTPSQIHSLKRTMAGGIGAAGATQVSPALERTVFSEEFEAGGVKVHSTININKDASDDAKGGVLGWGAIITAQLGGGPSAAKERDESLFAWEIVYSGRWGRVEYTDAHGREMLFDSANPTS